MLSLFLIILPCRADFGAREGMPLALQDEATTPVDGPTRAGGCDWPNPMYPPYKRKPRASVGRGLQTLRQLFEKHRATAFSYIDSGVALGMYRDGALIPGDSDIDVRWGASSPLKLPKKKTLDPLFSMNTFGKWGDKWTRRVLHPTKPSKADVAKVWGDLCLLSIVDAQGYYVHKAVMQRRALERSYGAAWFVRMPFKGLASIHEFYKKPDWWTRSLAVVLRIDANKDGAIQIPELNAWVKQEGIRVTEYDRQISPRDRCRAAATLTFLLRFDKKPFHISKDKLFRGDEHPLLLEATRACGK